MSTTPHPAPHLRTATAVRAILGLLVAATLLGGAPAARAQDAPAAPTLGGFTGSAAASGLHAQYNPQGLLPTGPPVDLGAPDALATIASGPSTFARASVADPGDLLANPEALLAQASAQYPAGTVPAYPFRISSSSGVGEPEVVSDPVPGLHARVTAVGGASTAEALLPAASAPAVLSVGSMAAYADTSTDGSTVTVHARAEFAGVDILGIVQIESIVTDLTATSSGGDTTLAGGTTVTGASVLGTPATIDDQGIRALGIDLGSVLGPLGIDITLPGPVVLDGTTTGQLASTGLRIDIEASQETIPAIGDLLDLLPPIPPLAPGAPGVEDVLAVARARHLVSVELGRGVVSLTARPTQPRATPPTTPATAGSASTPTPSPSGGTGSAPVARPSTPVAAVTPPAPLATAPVAVQEEPIAAVRTGIGALAVLALLLQPIIGDRLARAAAFQLATDQESCPWEQR